MAMDQSWLVIVCTSPWRGLGLKKDPRALHNDRHGHHPLHHDVKLLKCRCQAWFEVLHMPSSQIGDLGLRGHGSSRRPGWKGGRKFRFSTKRE